MSRGAQAGAGEVDGCGDEGGGAGVSAGAVGAVPFLEQRGSGGKVLGDSVSSVVGQGVGDPVVLRLTCPFQFVGAPDPVELHRVQLP